ncbi:C25 family cysteine peptidase, partial [bacterium]|nr:C25 family cysteine peptidase [bacterium]
WFRGNRIARILISPVQYNPVEKSLRVYKTLTLQVTFTRSSQEAEVTSPKLAPPFETLKSAFVLNPYPTDQASRDDLGFASDFQRYDWYDQQFTYLKLFIKENGVHSIGYEELLNHGLNVEGVDLAGLKIINRGEQIPLFISGPVGETFTPETNVLFYGEGISASDLDDFYTDTNVYWLTFDGDNGARYRVISDSLTEAPLDSFYWETKHFEEDHLFHRSNRTTPIEPDEAWIWRYLFEGDREVVDFDVTGLVETAPLCSLKVRLHGTTIDPVDPDHHVRFSLNGQIIGDSFFDGQEELLWVLSFPTSLLRSRENQLELELVADTGALVNQIYLDWIELIYPRLHLSNVDDLRFQKAISNTSARFSLVNFESDEIKIFNPAAGNAWVPPSLRTSFFKAESAGRDDGDYASFSVDFETSRFQSRGHTLVVIDSQTGHQEIRTFDTYASIEAANEMADFIDGLSEESIVLAAISDEGSENMTEEAHVALESLGSALTRQVGLRDSWALIGRKGASIGSVKETLSRRFDGPAVVQDTLVGDGAFRFAASFVDTTDGRGFYYAVSKARLKRVDRIEREDTSDLRTVSNGVDYLVITHADFKAAADRLANYRKQHNGFRSIVVDVRDVYDEFNYGLTHPRAIKDFLSYTYRHWTKPAPSYVLLLGDATWDPQHRMQASTKTNYIPSYGILVSDNWFVTLDSPDDLLPDMFIGRLPVETIEQAQIVIDKIISYEALPFDSWNKEMVFFNGGLNSIEQSTFLTQANLLIEDHIEGFPFHGKVNQFNKTSNEAISVSFRNAAAQQINEGALWVNFLGHAGSAVWDIDIGLPEDWQNTDVFPFITGMSCHSARFANPIQNSLSERFVLNGLGACGYWGSSGFGYITQDFFLLDGLFPAITKNLVRTLGEATTLSKLSLWQALGGQANSRNVIEQYTLIGDPALSLLISRKPELAIRSDEIEFDSDFLLISDSTATVSIKTRNYGLAPEDSIDLRVDVFSPNENLQTTQNFRIEALGYLDSVMYDWKMPIEPGRYKIQAHIDPQDRIDEEDQFNNLAEATIDIFSSDLSVIKPIEFGVVNSANIELVVNNSRSQTQDLFYYFELDTSSDFNSSTLIQSPAIAQGELVTRWDVTVIAMGHYFWRARTFDGANFGPWASSSFTYSTSNTNIWMQSADTHFEKLLLQGASLSANGRITLQEQSFYLKAESAGFLDGNTSVLAINGEVLGQNRRGHNLAAFEPNQIQTPITRSFDTYEDPANADAMAQFINDLSDNSIVMAAIRDEGSQSMTENAYLALESIGSQLTRHVGIRDSWAIIGRKGAAVGSVPEAINKVSEGRVVVTDTLFRFAGQGRATSPPIGPALRWRLSEFAYNEPATQGTIELAILGRNRLTGRTDTLRTGLSQDREDLTNIDSHDYPILQIQATMTTNDGLSTPELISWSVDYDPPSDLVIGRSSIELVTDTLDVGDDVDVNFKIGNFGLSASDSFSVTLSTDNSSGDPVQLAHFYTQKLAIDEIRQVAAGFSTTDLSGRTDIRVTLDSEDAVTELNETNNDFIFTIWVAQDTVSPDIRVTFDGHVVAGGDFVAAAPRVAVEIRDANNLTFEDTAQVSILLDESKVSYGTRPGQARLLPQQNAEDFSLKAIAVFEPRLSEGPHKIEVIAR